jgi:hypothetical protein
MECFDFFAAAAADAEGASKQQGSAKQEHSEPATLEDLQAHHVAQAPKIKDEKKTVLSFQVTSYKLQVTSFQRMVLDNLKP